MAKVRRMVRVGDKVRLTGEFLRATGQAAGPEGASCWVVRAIDREWAVVDQPADVAWYTAEELEADPSLRFRRIALGNLEVVSEAWWRQATGRV